MRRAQSRIKSLCQGKDPINSSVQTPPAQARRDPHTASKALKSPTLYRTPTPHPYVCDGVPHAVSEAGSHACGGPEVLANAVGPPSTEGFCSFVLHAVSEQEAKATDAKGMRAEIVLRDASDVAGSFEEIGDDLASDSLGAISPGEDREVEVAVAGQPEESHVASDAAVVEDVGHREDAARDTVALAMGLVVEEEPLDFVD